MDKTPAAPPAAAGIHKIFNIDNQECWDIAFLKDENARYKQALDEIEKIVSKNYYDDTWADISIKLDDILNIINNAKGEGKCQ